jgi:CHAD domain-containing protein
MGASVEREVKLRPGPDFEGLELPGRELPEHVLHSAYFDTDDLRLAAGSVTLRRRRSGKAEAKWQLKLPRSGSGRFELEWPAPDESVPGEIGEVLAALTRGHSLIEVAELKTHRSGVLVRDDGRDIAEVVHDDVEVFGERAGSRRFEELEIELVDGTERELQRLARRLRRAGAVDPDGRPKLMQALDIEPARAGTRKPRTAGDHLALALRRQYAEILMHDPGSRLGNDPEELHDHRTAIRRVRAYLRVCRPFVDRQWADGLRSALQPAGRSLADVRDLDVLIAELRAEAAGLDDVERPGATDIIALLEASRPEAQAKMRRDLADPSYVSVLNRLEIAVEEPRVTGTGSLRRIVRKEHRRARRLLRSSHGEPSNAELHEVRKAVKRARYAAELARDAGVSGSRRYIKRAKAVQDVLGEHQDAVVAEAVLDEIEPDLHRPIARMAAMSLRERQRLRREASRSTFPKSWRKLDAAAKSFS